LNPAVHIFLRDAYRQALQRRANELGVSETEVATRLVEAALEPHLAEEGVAEQREAERQLLHVAGEVAREESSREPWNERLIYSVFERIRQDHRSLYEQAISGGHKDAVNRRVARQIKAAAGADVKASGGRPMTAKPPRGSPALISNYTLLKRPQ
jgi:hypothetical protein